MPQAPATRSRLTGRALRAGDAMARWFLAASAGLLIATCLFGLRGAFAQGSGDEVDRLIQALESKGRALPDQAAAELEVLRPTTPEYSPQRLELLTVQGLMLAVAWQGAAAERAAAQLEAWGRDRQASVPAAAAVLIRASASARAGNFQRADVMLQQAMATLPPELPIRLRYRFVHTQAYIKEESGKLEDAVRLNHEALALADRQDELWRQSEARTCLLYTSPSPRD